MKTFNFISIALALSAMVAISCDNDKNTDTVSIKGNVRELIFEAESTSPQQTSIISSTDWVMNSDSSFIKFNPSRGNKGTTVVEVSLVDTETTIARKAIVTVVAGRASVVFKVVQMSPPKVQSIKIVAIQRNIVVGQQMPLEIKTFPEGSKLKSDISWSTSNASVISLDSNKARGLAEGSSVITATADGFSAKISLGVTLVFTTDGTGRKYKFSDLAALDSSGVTDEGNGVYTIKSSFTVSAEDTLTLENVNTLKLTADIEIKFCGMANFNPPKRVIVAAIDETTVPKPIYFTDERAEGYIENVEFVNCPIKFFGNRDLIIKKCKFTRIKGKNSAVNIGGKGMVTIENSELIRNSYSAISEGANTPVALIFKNNYLDNNSNGEYARNRPQINVTVGGNRDVEITGNTVIGPAVNTTNGGIAIANLLGIGGKNIVLLKGNRVSDCRYGITLNGVMNARLIDNVLENNRWDDNPMTGGSGISLYNTNGGQIVYMSGNTITGHYWGVTSIGSITKASGPVVNMGNITEGKNNNPGGNTFNNNGNNGVLYDFYNNSPMTVYAQNNKWGVETQNRESIENVIYHKADDASLGEVIFMPPAKK